MLFEQPGIPKTYWVRWILLYVGYVVFSLGISLLQAQPTSLYQASYIEKATNIAKVIINFVFLICSFSWSTRPRSKNQTIALDNAFHLIFLLTLLQLLVYISHSGFSLVGTATNSSTAAEIYNASLCFWGMPDKNVFGARIALFGFLYILMALLRNNKFPIYRGCIVFLCAFLSNSRTPMAALFLGIAYIIFRRAKLVGKICLTLFLCVITPFFLSSLIRVDNLLDSSDGMGIRLIYWSTFFTHFKTLSIFGSGFMSAQPFLMKYSPIYLGEPHLHNLFLNTYIDFGIPGLILYLLFLISFFRYCRSSFRLSPTWYRTAAFLPLVAIMLTLSTGYESDTVIYLLVIFLIGSGNAAQSSKAHKLFITTVGNIKSYSGFDQHARTSILYVPDFAEREL